MLKVLLVDLCYSGIFVYGKFWQYSDDGNQSGQLTFSALSQIKLFSHQYMKIKETGNAQIFGILK